jgi:hypothetical protein
LVVNCLANLIHVIPTPSVRICKTVVKHAPVTSFILVTEQMQELDAIFHVKLFHVIQTQSVLTT